MNPTVFLDGARGNAFKLLVRASDAARAAGWGVSQWDRFMRQARAREVVRLPTDETPPSLRQHVLDTVLLHFDEIEPTEPVPDDPRGLVLNFHPDARAVRRNNKWAIVADGRCLAEGWMQEGKAWRAAAETLTDEIGAGAEPEINGKTVR